MLTKYDLNINIFLLKKIINNEHCNVIHFEEIYFTISSFDLVSVMVFSLAAV